MSTCVPGVRFQILFDKDSNTYFIVHFKSMHRIADSFETERDAHRWLADFIDDAVRTAWLGNYDAV